MTDTMKALAKTQPAEGLELIDAPIPTPGDEDVLIEALCYHPNQLDNDSYEPLADVLNLAIWRARAGEAQLNERELAVTYPGEIGMTLGLDIDTVLQQDPINWKPKNDDE